MNRNRKGSSFTEAIIIVLIIVILASIMIYHGDKNRRKDHKEKIEKAGGTFPEYWLDENGNVRMDVPFGEIESLLIQTELLTEEQPPQNLHEGKTLEQITQEANEARERNVVQAAADQLGMTVEEYEEYIRKGEEEVANRRAPDDVYIPKVFSHIAANVYHIELDPETAPIEETGRFLAALADFSSRYENLVIRSINFEGFGTFVLTEKVYE